MGKLLVHLHLYYQDQTDYFLDRLSNITVPFTLIVTMTDENAEIRKKILVKFPDARIITVENSGYDVYPFFQAMKQFDLSSFDYILKIHTKNCRDRLKVNHLTFHGYDFRDNLVSPLIGTKKNFNRAFKAISSSGNVGIVCPRFFLVKSEAPGNYPMTEKLCGEYGIGYKKDAVFCSGTMFLCRSEIIRFLQKNDYSAADYGMHLKTGSVGTLAHSMETMFGLTCSHLGYEVKGLRSNSLHFSLIFFIKLLIHKDIRWLLSY